MRTSLAAAGLLAALAVGAASAQTTTTVVTTTHHKSSQKPIAISVNGEDVPFHGPAPMMSQRGDAVLVPLRGVFERLGGQVQWEPSTRVITGARPGHQFRIRVGTSEALVDGQKRMLTAPPQVMDGTTYVPLRFASEALGAKVTWQPDIHTVAIETTPADTGATTTTTTTTTTKKKP